MGSVGARPTAPFALPRVLGSLALRIETAGVGGRAVVHPLGAPAEWVAVGLQRVLVRLRMVVGGRMPSPTFRMVVRRWRAFRTKIVFVAGPPPAGVGECHCLGRWQPPGSFGYCSLTLAGGRVDERTDCAEEIGIR